MTVAATRHGTARQLKIFRCKKNHKKFKTHTFDGFNLKLYWSYRNRVSTDHIGIYQWPVTAEQTDRQTQGRTNKTCASTPLRGPQNRKLQRKHK